MREYAVDRDRFTPAKFFEDACGLRPSVKAILDLVDTTDPSWPAVAVALQEFTAADIELDAAAVAIAVKLGKQRWAGEEQRGGLKQATLACTADEVVYYIRRGDLIKIGTTKRPRMRFSDLLPDEVLAVEPGGRKEEDERHWQFRHLRQAGEYFRDEPELREHIQRIRALHGDPDPSWPTMATKKGTQMPWRLTEPSSTETLTVAEAVSQLGIKQNTLYQWVRRGRLHPAGRDERRRQFFYRDHLIQLRDSRNDRVAWSL